MDFILNGQLTEYSGKASSRLLDVLRSDYNLTGTKCGCLEGECGACSVIINGKLQNSCLAAMGSLEGASVITIEGYAETERFNVLDEAYKSVSAVQCGFCIPGMILSSECLLAENPAPSEDEIREAISGNLCRCTGYNSIVKAIGIATGNMPRHSIPQSPAASGISAINIPHPADDALKKLKQDPDLIPYCGGTDLMTGKDCCDKKYLYIGNMPGLKQITEDGQYIRFGAACTFTETIKHPLTPQILKEMCMQIAAPAIRNAGTLGGNIANGSAKADAALIFAATDSLLRLQNADGERIIPVCDFYTGGGKTALLPGELIIEVLMPERGLNNYCLEKVGARKALAISRVSFAGIIDIKDNVINNLATAFGAVTDVIIRRPDIDRMLIGKTTEDAKKLRGKYLEAYDAAIVPRRGRVSVQYRKNVCMNLLKDFIDKKLNRDLPL